ncbi:hypothetical protein ACH9D2_04060 [Kocuria sp. M4R2S49]|uniref:hypothetical protein n=1 Tax=Kocuria rhizosphaericola TaxID=3376284 RepID=UPI00378CCD25
MGLHLRCRPAGTPISEELGQTGRTEGNVWTELKDLVTHYWRPMLTLSGLVIALDAANCTLLSPVPTCLEGKVGMGSRGS